MAQKQHPTTCMSVTFARLDQYAIFIRQDSLVHTQMPYLELVVVTLNIISQKFRAYSQSQPQIQPQHVHEYLDVLGKLNWGFWLRGEFTEES